MMQVKKYSLDENRTDVHLTTYILDDSQELLNGKKRPAVIVCPGGAYLMCSDREGEAVALRFAAMGYHAFVLRYHVYTEPDGSLEDAFKGEIEPKAETMFPAQIKDIAKAFTLIHDHKEEWLVDTERIALCGFSAGGNNVTNYAVHWNKPILTDEFAVETLKPAAIIAGYPITDYLAWKQVQDELTKGLFRASNLAFLGSTEPTEEQLLQVSSARLIDDTTPPMFIWATAGDHAIPVSQSTRLATALAEKNIPFELHIFEEGEHGLSLATQASARHQGHLNTDARKWIDLAESWLEKRFALSLEE